MAGGLSLFAVTAAAGSSLLRGPSPYVITAVDNHFHDAHPTFPLDPARSIVVKNAGRSLHNVTLVGTDFSQDLASGEELTIPRAGELLGGPGRYALVCAYHDDRGMTGVIVVE